MDKTEEMTERDTIFSCPTCGEALSATVNQARCSNNHVYDRAREGYFHLLPSGRRGRSGTPGDTPESLQARRRFLHAGWYSPIAEAVSETLNKHAGIVVDVGCGEGWYLSQMSGASLYGLDISKRAIHMASKYLPQAQFCVGTAHRLPIQSQSCDAVFTVFAPHSHQEYLRILKLGGRWVTVTPGSHHLHEMRPRRSEAVDRREERRNEPPPHVQSAHRLTFTLTLDDNAAADLFAMTPLQWQTAADAAPSTAVTVDVWVGYGTNI